MTHFRTAIFRKFSRITTICIFAATLCTGGALYASGIATELAIHTNISGCGEQLVPAKEFIFDSRRALVQNDTFRLGTNILFWIDTKSDWRKFDTSSTLTDLGVKVLRFPGGEVADNYDWENNEVERDDQFPKEAKTVEDKLDRLDYKTFLLKAKEVGAEDIYFVTNLEGAFFKPGSQEENIRKYAESAARWVKEVKAAGFTVKYWEVGNEPYHHSAFPLTAQEYAHALQIFSKAMKSTNPDIQIGAVGPWSISGSVGTSFADRLHPSVLKDYRAGLLKGVSPCKHQNKDNCAERLNRAHVHESKPWWPQLIMLAPDAFDFVVVHRYGFHSKRDQGGNGDFTRAISRLKDFLAAARGRDVPIALTEWNVPTGASSDLLGGDHAVEVAAQILSYHRAGVRDLVYWPFRLKGKNFSLVDPRSAKRSGAYETLRLLAAHSTSQETLFPNEQLPDGVEVLASHAKGEGGLIISGVNNSKRTQTLIWPDALLGERELTAIQLTSLGDRLHRSETTCTTIDLRAGFKAALPPKSVMTIRIHPRTNVNSGEADKK